MLFPLDWEGTDSFLEELMRLWDDPTNPQIPVPQDIPLYPRSLSDFREWPGKPQYFPPLGLGPREGHASPTVIPELTIRPKDVYAKDPVIPMMRNPYVPRMPGSEIVDEKGPIYPPYYGKKRYAF